MSHLCGLDQGSELECSVMAADPTDLTGLLKAWGAGDQGALEQLTPLVYDELRAHARRCMRSERSGATLQSTALVHEVYVRLLDADRVDWNDRVHFFALSARLMRRILVDAARARTAAKRGGPARRMDHLSPSSLTNCRTLSQTPPRFVHWTMHSSSSLESIPAVPG